MGNQILNGRHVAVLATDGFEQSELQEPKRLLEEAGATVHVIAPDGAKQIKAGTRKIGAIRSRSTRRLNRRRRVTTTRWCCRAA